DKVGAQVKILSMVKANGYGHGAVPVARTLSATGGDAFGVATLEEAVDLRDGGIQAPILVLAGIYLNQLEEFFNHSLTPVVHDLVGLKQLDEAVESRGTSLSVHVKIDTGMGRLGFLTAEADAWIPALKNLRALKLAG